METAVLLCVPEAEHLVAPWRADGALPPHVVVMSPFCATVDGGALEELRWFFAGVDGFDLTLAELEDGAGAVEVRVEQADEVRQLTAALARRWPECSPTSLAAAPHLPVLRTDDEQMGDRARQQVASGLPLVARVTTAALWERVDGAWHERAAFPLGPLDPG